MNLQQIRNQTEQLKGQRRQLAADAEAGVRRLSGLKQEAIHVEEARVIIQHAAQATQKQLEYRISEVCSFAMAAVFDHPYSLKIEFVTRRNKTEADVWFERDGERVKPVDAAGGGAVDVAALALRVAVWSLRRPRSRNTLILDEPAKMLSADLMPGAADMVHELSRRLGLQFIIVSHSQELIEGADRWFHVNMDIKGVSHVEASDKENDSSDNSQYPQAVKKRHKGSSDVASGQGYSVQNAQGFLPEERRTADLQNIGNTCTVERTVDEFATPSSSACSWRGEGTASTDRSERPQGVRAVRAPRRKGA